MIPVSNVLKLEPVNIESENGLIDEALSNHFLERWDDSVYLNEKNDKRIIISVVDMDGNKNNYGNVGIAESKDSIKTSFQSNINFNLLNLKFTCTVRVKFILPATKVTPGSSTASANV